MKRRNKKLKTSLAAAAAALELCCLFRFELRGFRTGSRLE